MHFLYKSSVAFSCDVYSQTIFKMNIIFATEYISHTHARSLTDRLACSLTLPTAAYDP